MWGLAWSPKGNEIWFTATTSGQNRDLFAVDLFGKRRTVLPMPGDLMLHDIAPDGRVLLTVDEDRTSMVGFSVSKNRETDLSWLDNTMALDISRDARKILFNEQGWPTGANHYFAMRDIDRSPPVRLGEGFGGLFSPDERWTASVVPDTPESIMLLPIGAGQPKVIEHKGIKNTSWRVAFMPDGQHLAYTGTELGHAVRTYIQDLSGGKPRAVTPEGAIGRVPSPDGKYLAGYDAENNLTVYPVNGGPPLAPPGVPKGFIPSRWSPDSRYVYIYRRGDVPCKVYRLDWRSGRQELVKELIPSDPAGVIEIFPIVTTPDAKLFVYSYDRYLSELYIVAGVH